MNELRRSPWTVLTVLCLGHVLVLLDLSIVNVAIPSIVDGLHASLDQVLWVRNAYILVYAVLLITAGRLGDRHGPRRVYVAGLVVFLAASAACGQARDPNQLIAGRVVQAAGAALLTPQTLVFVTAIFPPERRGAAFGTWSALAGLAALAGPVVGGVITTYADWRWVFYANLPVGALVLLAIPRVVPDLRPGRTAGRVDPVGVALATAGFAAVLFALIDGQRFAWGAVAEVGGIPVTVPALLVAGVLVAAAFFAWDRLQPFPLVPLGLFADRDYSVMICVGILHSFAMLGISLPIVIYLQSALGYTPLQASLTLVPMLMVTVAIPPLAGRLTDRLGGRYVIAMGLTVYAAGLAYLALVAAAGSSWLALQPGFLASGLGIACTIAPVAAVAMHGVRPQVVGAAAGLLNTTQQLGGALGGAVIGAVLQAGLASGLRGQAVRLSSQLPAGQRAPFVSAFGDVARAGLDVGRASTAAAGVAAGLPPGAARLAHQAFALAFVDAFRASLLLCAAVVLVAAVGCLAVRRRAPASEGEAARAAAPPAAAEGSDA